ncbi:SGNH/GDSL hydrolase family protein [Microbacterium karelineae]|uniref:SGNH/GDSL hydrolase family protein n=1 Tax=Microbacterium karelineae TaxID=2654283 RepID=UPI0012EA36C1|nr:SGNH/GDSL hydrolase family protein [Microbacterium karelineae]
MPRVRRLLAAACAIALGSATLGACASEPHGVDLSGSWPTVAGPEDAATDADPSLLVFGDSWTVGLASSTPTGGYAYLTGELLGWDTTVDGENGSGYLRPGEFGGLYGSRVVQLDPDLDPEIVVVQGSINDRGENLDRLSGAAQSVWRALEALYPDAELVVLGPAPSTIPVADTVGRIDRVLSRLAEREGVTYISPVQDEWITSANYDDVIDTSSSGHNHPSDDGHAFLAEALADHLRDLEPDESAVTAQDDDAADSE